MKATELINTLQGFVEKHGDNVEVYVELEDDWFDTFTKDFTVDDEEVVDGAKGIYIWTSI